MRCLFVVLAIVVSACGSSTAPAATSTATERPEPTATAPTQALDQMVLAFDGSHSRRDIKSMMDGTLAMYGLPLTEENYSRAGSTLVGLQEQNKRDGCTSCGAMEIATQMELDGHVEALTYAQAAAIASTELVLGE